MEKNILKKALLMCEKNVDFDNIDNWQNADFDMICLIRGVKVRLPFDVGKDLNPYGIFPFANENWFLELYETKGECSRTLAEELKLPSLSEYAKLYNIRKELNKKLEELKAPLLSGVYFAARDEENRQSQIVGFLIKDFGHLPKGYYTDDETAKVRYKGSL